MKIGVLAVQGAFIEHVRTFRSIGSSAVEVRLPADLEGVAGLVLPGRREHGDAPAHRPVGAPRADHATWPHGRAAVRHVRRDDPRGPRDRHGEEPGPAAPRRDRGAQRVRASARFVRGGRRRADPRRPAGPRRVHPGAGHHAHGPGVDILATLDDGRIVAVREGNVIATAFHPELAGETRFHRLVATMAAEHDDPARAAAGGTTPRAGRRATDDPSGTAR